MIMRLVLSLNTPNIKRSNLRGWMDTKSNLWCIPLVEVVRNNNMDTIAVN